VLTLRPRPNSGKRQRNEPLEGNSFRSPVTPLVPEKAYSLSKSQSPGKHQTQASPSYTALSNHIENLIEFTCSPISQDTRPHVVVSIYGHNFNGLLDSGADCTVLGEDGLWLLNSLSLETKSSKGVVKTADGGRHLVVATCDLPFVFRNACQLVKTLIVPSFPKKLILGINFWRRFGIEPTMNGKKIALSDNEHLGEISTVEDFDDVEKEEALRAELTPTQEGILEEVRAKFPKSTESEIGLTTLLKHKINTNGLFPPKQRFYPVSPAILKEVDKEIDRMLKLGVIEGSESPSSNPIVVVRKATGKVRLCLDSRKLNEITVKDAFPLPLINDILGRLTGTTYLSSIDLKDAFWQIELEDEAKPKTAFTVPGRGLFQFKRMPFGLCNAAQSLSRLMHQVIGCDMEPEVFTYLDDIVIATKTFEDHVNRLLQVAERLKKAGLTISVDKSRFCVQQLRYLGYLIDSRGLHPDPEKVCAITDYPIPKNVREVRRFLGMTGWYQRFIKNYAELACPLTGLLKTDTRFCWTAEANRSFDLLRNCLISAPILTPPNFSQNFTIQCDASDRAIGAVLTQGEGPEEKVVAFMSKKFTGPQCRYAATEKECLAVLVAVKKFRQYVEGSRFRVITDCAALKWLAKFNDATNGRLCRWALQLQQYDFEIIHRKGKNNCVPDALSRIEALRHDDAGWKEENGRQYCRIFSNRTGPEWKLVVDENDRIDVLRKCHDAPTAGHMGQLKTLSRVQEKYYWPGMTRDIREYVKACEVCKRSKNSSTKHRGLMGQPKPAARPWQVVSIDFLGPLPRSKKGKTFIVVATDAFTKMVVAEALHNSTTNKLVEFLENQVFLKQQVPEILISDNGPQFLSKQFIDLLKTYSVQHWTNSVYHPQNNPTERVNQVIGNCLRCYVGEDHRDWDKNLPKIVAAINTSHHESTGYTPYFLNFGRHMRLTGESPNEEEQETMLLPEDMTEVFLKVRKNLEKAYEKSAKRYNLRARPRLFNPGDRAWRKNFFQSDAKRHFSAKLAPKNIPGKIVRKLGATTYLFRDDETGRESKYSVNDLFPD
jgi:transposase InsO family protein